MNKEISVIVPAYNEASHIEETVESVVDYFRRKHYKFEVLIVNDGSADSTLERARGLEKRLSEVHVIDLGTNHGKGLAVKEGIGHARYAYSLFLDADNSTHIREWDKFEPFFESGARVVVASRRLPASRIVHEQPPARRVLGGVYRGLCKGFFGLDVSDFNCGFKAYETALAKEIYAKVQMLDWAFDTEVFCLLKEKGIKAEEVPVTWEHRDKPSHLAPFKAGLNTFGSLLRLKKKY
jgi:glycosyltransferase involved in cell wall biosynthesis